MGGAQITVNSIGEGRSADLISILNTKDIYDDDFECKYLTIEEMYGRTSPDTFSILSQNVRSLGGKFDQPKEYVGRYSKNKITCIMLQEVWSVGRTYNLPGYHNIEYNTRDKNQTLNSNCGGGVGIYVSNSLDYEVLQFKNEFIEGVYESIWVKIHLGHGQTKILGCVYRPNTNKGDIQRAISLHEAILQELRNDKNYKQSDLLIFQTSMLIF